MVRYKNWISTTLHMSAHMPTLSRMAKINCEHAFFWPVLFFWCCNALVVVLCCFSTFLLKDVSGLVYGPSLGTRIHEKFHLQPHVSYIPSSDGSEKCVSVPRIIQNLIFLALETHVFSLGDFWYSKTSWWDLLAPAGGAPNAQFRRAASVLSRWGEGGEGAGKGREKLGKSLV